jgi:hypothetical protein
MINKFIKGQVQIRHPAIKITFQNDDDNSKQLQISRFVVLWLVVVTCLILIFQYV